MLKRYTDISKKFIFLWLFFAIILTGFYACKHEIPVDDSTPKLCTTPDGNCPEFINYNLTVNPNGTTPLVGIIGVSSNQPVKISYTVKGQDGEDFTYSNDTYTTDNSINLFGLYPAYENTVTISISNKKNYITQKTITVKTDPVPASIPQPNEIIVNMHNPNLVSKFILFSPNKFKAVTGSLGASTVVIDSYGKIRWYFTDPTLTGKISIPLKNGNWLVMLPKSFVEINLLGTIIKNIPLPFASHHDVVQASNGDLIYLGESTFNNTVEDKVYRIDYLSGSLLDSINIYTILDPLRSQLPVGPPNDWLHENSIAYDATDNAIIVSGRQQSAFFKINLATKKLSWIVSDSTGWNRSLKNYLLTPSGGNFEQQWGQHSVILKPGDNHTILLFDNGNDRSYTNPIKPINNYSRCVEFTINEATKTIAQNFEFGKSYGSELFAPYIGNVQYISNNHILIDYGGIYKDINNNAIDISNPTGKNQIRIFEVDKEKKVYLDISVKTTNDQVKRIKIECLHRRPIFMVWIGPLFSQTYLTFD